MVYKKVILTPNKVLKESVILLIFCHIFSFALLFGNCTCFVIWELYVLCYLRTVRALLFGNCMCFVIWELYVLCYLGTVRALLFENCTCFAIWELYVLCYLGNVRALVFGNCTFTLKINSSIFKNTNVNSGSSDLLSYVLLQLLI